MDFELFTQFGRGHRPTCSIRSNGQIGLNQGAIRRFRLEDGFVALYYDRNARVVGIKPVPKDAPGATRLIVKPNNAFVSARSFLEFYAIPYRGRTSTYEVEWSNDYDMLLVDLSKPTRPAKAEVEAQE